MSMSQALSRRDWLQPTTIHSAVRSALQAMALLSFAGSVWAQQSTDESKVQKVEITGSSIKRINAETALPVQIVGRAEIARSGASSAEQLLASLSVNTGFTQESASISDKPGSSGLSAANLRGLGVSSTLVLLNGRRQIGRAHV